MELFKIITFQLVAHNILIRNITIGSVSPSFLYVSVQNNTVMRVYYILFQEWQITHLSYEYDSEPFGKERDAAIQKLASEAGVEVMVRISHTLYNLDK